MSFIQVLQIIIGMIGIIFLPGFLLTLIFFPTKEKKDSEVTNLSSKKRLGWLERFLLSVALSVSSVPLVLFFLSKLGMLINQLNVIFVVSAMIILEIIYLLLIRKKIPLLKRQPKDNDNSS